MKFKRKISVYSHSWKKWGKSGCEKFDKFNYHIKIRHLKKNPAINLCVFFSISGSRVAILNFTTPIHERFTSLMLVSNIIIFEEEQQQQKKRKKPTSCFFSPFWMCVVAYVLNVWTNGDNNEKTDDDNDDEKKNSFEKTSFS